MMAEEENTTYYYEEHTVEEVVEIKNVFDAGKCQVENVTVYLDRAEVCRSIKTRITKGENQINIKRLSPSIEKDSLRVEGKGPATILEVIYSATQLSPEEDENEQRHQEVRRQLHDLTKQKEAMESRKKRLQKQREVLDGFADNLLKTEAPEKNDKERAQGGQSRTTRSSSITFAETEAKLQVQVPNTLDGNLLEGMCGFFDLYEKQATRLDDSMHQLVIDLERLEEQIEKTGKNLKEMEIYKEEHMAREVVILMEATEDGEVELLLSYVVNKAKWSPRYDIRVFSGDSRMKLPHCYNLTKALWSNYSDFEQISRDSRMKIIYYGMIQQATGEDWDEAKLTLSTASPSVGGTVPDLGTQRLFFKPKYHPMSASMNGVDMSPRVDKTKSMKKKRPQSAMIITDSSNAFNRSFDEALMPPLAEEKPRSSAEQSRAEREAEYKDLPLEDRKTPLGIIKENITSTCYEVVRHHTIPSDNVAHKVSIAIIDLNPVFEYESVPKRSPYAYLRAKVKNTSPYALLAGQTSIFLDNNFCAKAEIKAVAPQEDFTCSLGADHGIKIAYRPLHKYREHSGALSKNLTMTHKQVIEVKNTHAEPIKILIMDQLPLAAEEKIKVNLLEPVIKHPEKYDRSKPIRLNKFNNIEWELEIPPGEGKELTLKYSVEHPVAEEVDASILHVTHSHEV
ncbi:protein F37C4.5-like isoform X12 [Lineus longissimus]|uniref:protein F37C4.5-like isoform X12 n=1 Tax=Lineus longissimus TaxID=88925 RepID=UPI00315C55BE